MGLAGCGKFVKFTMIFANVLIFIGGVSVLGVGIWTCVDKTSFADVIGSDLYLAVAYIMIVTGSIIALIAFLGCLGAWTENKCLLVTYFIILLLIFITLLVAGILGYVYKDEMGGEVRNQMYTNIDKNFEKNPKLEEVFYKMQRELKCCGVNPKNEDAQTNNQKAYMAWTKNSKFPNSGKDAKVPESCCNVNVADKVQMTNCQQNPKDHAFKLDCYDAVKTAATDHAMVLGGVGVGIACVLLLGMIFSFILCMTIQ